MKIRHERPMSDLEYKVRAPLQLELQSGEIVDVREWSQAGLTYPIETDLLPMKGFLTIPFQGVDIRFSVNFSKGDGPQDLVFKDLTGRQREVISLFYRSILSGKMAPSEDVITSLDTPVDLVPMGETEDEEAAGKANKSPRFLRVIWNVFFYLILSVVLFGLIGGQIYDRLSSVNFSSGRVVAPLIVHRAAGAAYVDRILVAPMQQVRRGDTLVRLTNPELDGEVDDIRRDITRSEKQVRRARTVLNQHLANKPQARAQLMETYQRAVFERTYEDFTAGRELAEVLSALRDLRSFDAGQILIPGDFHDIERQLKIQLDDAKEGQRRLKRDLANAKGAARSYDILAQEDGVVTEILVFKDEFVERGRDVLSLEENTTRFVQAWVDEARAEAIYVGMKTDVRYRTSQGKRQLDGIVSDISAGIDPTTDNGFGMIVTIELPQFDLAESRAELRDTAPVSVRGLKDWRMSSWWQ